MTIEKLQRVMERLRISKPWSAIPTNHELRKAVIYEIGYDVRTYKHIRKALIALGWIKHHNKSRVQITGRDLTDT